LWLLEHEAVHVHATEAHDTEKRIPVLSAAHDAAAQICGQEVAEALVEANPAAIVNSQPLPYFPRPVLGSYRKTSGS
ncbi:MAG: CpsB/CapC family capsule biosynthesis tyrosine phosphatase, partial [Candidatus Sulfotelmatobacter sp.]